MKNLSQLEAMEIYQILIDDGGAADGPMADSFIREYTSKDPSREWRFSGKLGFGGKFRFHPEDNRRPLYVDCYEEHLTPERRAIIDGINRKLRDYY